MYKTLHDQVRWDGRQEPIEVNHAIISHIANHCNTISCKSVMLEDFANGGTWSEMVRGKKMEDMFISKAVGAACRLLRSHSKNYVSPTKARILVDLCGCVGVVEIIRRGRMRGISKRITW
jgi:hypothetical protein